MSNLRSKRNCQKSALNCFALVSPPGKEDLDRDARLFPDSSDEEYKPDYLELPIKVEGDFRSQREPKSREAVLQE